jgi:Na+/H+ antiporter NhaD/arsenite permease-like protein
MSGKNRFFILVGLLLLPIFALAATDTAALDLTQSGYGILALALFVIAYLLVISEEFLHLRKSKPVVIAAGMIWMVVALAYAAQGMPHAAEQAFRANLLEYAELMLFLLAAMTYINTLQERRVFLALRSWLVARDFSLRTIFWLTGILAFFISSIADNLTTALLMCAVITAVAGSNRSFLVVACINLVVAANAGGAFTPFGDITSLMVWQKGKVHFFEFFALLLPAFVNWFIPALCMSFVVPKTRPRVTQEKIAVLPGGYVVMALFIFTIAMTVAIHQFLHLPPVLGMMTGLGLLKVYGYFLRRTELASPREEMQMPVALEIEKGTLGKYYKPRHRPFDIFLSIKRAEWDTLLFFYGVVLCVGGLGALGYLTYASTALYGSLGSTWANITIGLLSAVVDNIPVMYAVLNMNQEMSLNQWLLVTLTTGVGGSLLSIGSAAGVALMGQARGVYTFFAHLRWTWAIALGYAASIAVHLWLNGV